MGSFQCSSPSKLQFAALYIALVLGSLGIGGTRFTIATMGADQFDKPKDQGIFFTWYVLALYVANSISLTAIVYIQDNVSWGLAFGICVVANAIALILFLSGKRFYRCMKPNGSPFISILRIAFAAVRKRNVSGTYGNQDYYYGSVETTNILKNGPSKSFRFLNRAALKIEGDDNQSSCSGARSWKLCTVQEVEDLKTLLKIMPLWSSSILLSTTIGMLYSLVILQVLTMDRHLGSHFKIPAGSFQLFNLLATALSIFIIDRFLHPTWQKFIPHWTLTPLRRIGIGHVINILAMVVSALIEKIRLHVVRIHQLSKQPGSVVPMSGLWLVVPLTVLGIGEALHFPGQIALYYQEFPKSLKSTSTAMTSLPIAIAFYLSTALTDLVRRTTGWLPDNINEGRLDNVFWMSAVIGGVNLGYYLVCAKLFKYQNLEKPNDTAGDHLPH
ncbi:protein NRT1/ PTR FAMILY 2.6-like [Durio zibethinus]|uniref:Protein NRT1/ PTR FAMILY 2.6-like n=1 Tax=Durio zibethinus TaxID=66656 RepID=A0A6P6AHE5_DURZI|nr:protein NRT1/ PTR FAMILY 2.6-like [Durio zibethinus]